MKKLALLSIFAFCFILSQATWAVNNQIIQFGTNPNLPYFQSQQATIDSAELNTLILRVDSKQAGTARLFWANHYDPRFNQPKSLHFYVKRGLHNYYFNVASQNPNWIGWIKSFLLYPEFNKNSLEIKEAKAVQGSILTNIKSGWQEFWGPKGRMAIGSTINLIPSSFIFGRSVNIYIYWIVGIFFIVFFGIKFAQEIKKTKDYQKIFDLTLNETTKKTLILTLIFWLLLALNTDHNYLNIFKSNLKKYYGKTIEQKRAIAYGKDYYDFLVFAKEKLPKEPVKFGLISSNFAPELRARIYLVPHVYADYKEKDVLYLLVYKPKPEQKKLTKDYSLFAKLNNNAYLLKRAKK